MKNGVQYYGIFLMNGSTAYGLWELMQKDPKVKDKLDKHLKEVDKKYKEMTGT